MRDEGESPREAGAPGTAPPSSGLRAEIAQLGRAVKRLFGAQLHLLAAELGLARSAVSWLLLAALAATVAGVGVFVADDWTALTSVRVVFATSLPIGVRLLVLRRWSTSRYNGKG